MDGNHQFRRNPQGREPDIKKISLLAFDLDGTLLNGNQEITPGTLQAIQRALQKGVKLTISSGRIPLMMDLFVELVGLNGPYISANGAIVQTDSERILFRKKLEETTVASLSLFCQENNLHYALLCEREIYFTDGNPRAQYFDSYALLCQKNNFPVPQRKCVGLNMAGYAGEDVYKILVCSEGPDASFRLKHVLMLDETVTYALSNRGLFDIMANGTDKGTGIALVANYYDIPLQETCAFGDYENDIQIFQQVGISVAMGNALLELQQIADFCTAGNENDGIAHALEALEKYY